MGGDSSEREISLESGKAVSDALCRAGFCAKPMDIRKKDAKEILQKEKLDVAFIALHGKFGEDGQIQQLLEKLNIAYTGSGVAASRLAMDKIASRKIFMQNKINVPGFKAFKKNERMDFGFGFPLVVKPARQGSSIGLSIVRDKKGLKPAIELAFDFDEEIIIEEYIKGKEITVGVLDSTPLPPIEIVPKKAFFDFEAKYIEGLTDYIIPAKISLNAKRQAQQLALLAHKALGCRAFSRIDMMMDEKNKIYVLELNSIPGLTTHSLLPKAANSIGIDFAQLCVKIIESSLNNDSRDLKKDSRDYEKKIKK